MQSYEFSESQNGLIKDLAQKMQAVGSVLVVIAVLALLGAVSALFQGLGASGREQTAGLSLAFSNAIQGILLIVVGLWTRKAGSSFNLIVTTQGNDIENLMGALGELRKLYRLQYFLILISLAFILVAFVLGIVAVLFSAGR